MSCIGWGEWRPWMCSFCLNVVTILEQSRYVYRRTSLTWYLTQYLWKGRITKLSFPVLFKHRIKGDVSFPAIGNYYYAAILDQMMAWFDPKSEKLWVHIEKAMLGHRDLLSLLLAKLMHVQITCLSFPSIESTVLAWYKLHHMIPPESTVTCANIPLQIYEYLIPNLIVLPWL